MPVVRVPGLDGLPKYGMRSFLFACFLGFTLFHFIDGSLPQT